MRMPHVWGLSAYGLASSAVCAPRDPSENSLAAPTFSHSSPNVVLIPCAWSCPTAAYGGIPVTRTGNLPRRRRSRA
jgi:hypothetical protein